MTEREAAARQSGTGCCSLQNAFRKALAAVDDQLDFSYLDQNGDGAVDMITVCVCVH